MKSATAAFIVVSLAVATQASPSIAGEQPSSPASAAPAPAAPAPAAPAPASVKPPADMAPKMTTYYMAFLRRSPKWTPGGAGVAELQRAHMANIQRLSKEGKMVLAGPFLEQTGPGSLAGLFVLQASSLAEAQQLVATDPAVQAGRFTFEIVPWMGPKVLARIPALFDEGQ